MFEQTVMTDSLEDASTQTVDVRMSRLLPDYSVPEGHELLYSRDLRSVENLELVW